MDSRFWVSWAAVVGGWGHHMAYLRVHSLASSLYFSLSVLYILAISGTNGSSGFGSHNREQMDKRTGKKLKQSTLSHLCSKIWTKEKRRPDRIKENYVKRLRRKATICTVIWATSSHHASYSIAINPQTQHPNTICSFIYFFSTCFRHSAHILMKSVLQKRPPLQNKPAKCIKYYSQ